MAVAAHSLSLPEFAVDSQGNSCSSSPTNGTSAPNSSPAHEDHDAMDSHHFAFTPRREQFLPRAWERRPATPFAPRNDTQKIWKRPPLQNVSTNSNPVRRRADARGNIETRPVKRLRLKVSRDESDKENLDYIGVKWDSAVSPASGQLRRKATVDRSSKPEEIYDATISHLNRKPDSLAQTAPQLPPSSRELNSMLQPVAENEKGLIGNLRFQEKRSEISLGLGRTVEGENVHPTKGSPPPALAASNLEEQASPATVPSLVQYCNGSSEGDVAESSDAETESFDEISQTEEITITDFNSQAAALTQERDIFDIPLQVLNEKQITEGIMPPERLNPSPDSGTGFPGTSQLSTLLGSGDLDDTAYLHGFLSRARAQKAARQQPADEIATEPRLSPLSPVEHDPPRSELAPRSPISFRTEIVGDMESSSATHRDDMEAEIQISSPCRRSSRLTTRLPRPQRPVATLASNIPLKRLNGTEFISMQRESQSLALATRANTRKNKGEAIPVFLKLLQLHTELWEGLPESSKRKRKNGKVVTWDETLARFQDDDGAELAVLVPSEPASMEQNEITEVQEEKKPTRRVRKIRKASVGSVNGTPAPKRSIEMLVSGSEMAADSVEGQSLNPKKRTRSRAAS